MFRNISPAGDTDPIIKWLKESGCTNQIQAKSMMYNLVQTNIVLNARLNNTGDLGGLEQRIKLVLDAFPEK
jgi:hypothetical protein